MRHIKLSAVVGWGLHRHAPAEYIVGIRPATPDPEPTAEEIAAWRARWGATCSEKTARTLCALEQAFSLDRHGR